MALWSLYSGAGPALTSDAGIPFQSGVTFMVTEGGCWYNAHRWWVPAGGDTAPQEFALWAVSGAAGAGTVVPGTTVTSGTLTAGAWNIIPLPVPVPLSVSQPYEACTGWTTVHGFPDTETQFSSGGPFEAGITSGPVYAFSDGTAGGSGTVAPFGLPQGQFSSASGKTDPALYLPHGGSDSANFGIDVVISDTAPAGFAGPWSLWPNNVIANTDTVADLGVNYIVATEITLAVPCQWNAARYFSASGCSQLATRAAIWSVAKAAEVAAIASPSWSGAAGSGWLQASNAAPPVIPAGDYRISVYNGAGSPASWSSKDASSGYWATGAGSAGITNGPVSAPKLSAASKCWEYSGSVPGATPPYSTGTQEPGQSPFGQLPSGANTFPQLYVDGLAQNYWVDGLFTPATASGGLAPWYLRRRRWHPPSR